MTTLRRTCLALIWLPQWYHPNGTKTHTLYHAPCGKDHSDLLASICCVITQPNHDGCLRDYGPTADTCLDNGIYMNRYEDNKTEIVKPTLGTNVPVETGKLAIVLMSVGTM
jgi:hypothetical protein